MGSPVNKPKQPMKRTPTDDVLMDVAVQRRKQRDKYGIRGESHPDVSESECFIIDELEAKMLCREAEQKGMLSWTHILGEEVAEAISEAMNGRPELLREELVQVAAVCVAWVEAIDRRKAMQAALRRTNGSQSEKVGG